MESYKALLFARREENDFTIYSYNIWRLTFIVLLWVIFDSIFRYFLFIPIVYELVSIVSVIFIFVIPMIPYVSDLLRSKEKRLVKNPRGERELWLKLPPKK